MSRSYKKTPIVKSGGQKYRKFVQRAANKKVRKYKNELQNGKWYRKLYPQWEIYDHVFMSTFQEHLDKHERNFQNDILKFGTIENMSEWRILEHLDKDHMDWKKYFYIK